MVTNVQGWRYVWSLSYYISITLLFALLLKKPSRVSDITNIEIQSGQDSASRANRSYNYRIVMSKGDTHMDMRGNSWLFLAWLMRTIIISRHSNSRHLRPPLHLQDAAVQ